MASISMNKKKENLDDISNGNILAIRTPESVDDNHLQANPMNN